MTTIELFRKLKNNLPLILCRDELFHKRLNDEYRSYLHDLKELDKQEFHSYLNHSLEELISTEKYIIVSIEDIIYNVRNGNIPTAYTKIRNLLNKRIKDKILIEYHRVYESKEKTFYRIIGMQDSEINRTHAYHRNFKDIADIPNYRFSMNGFPCLYLGGSKEVCYRECKNDGEQLLNVYNIAEDKIITFLSIAPPLTEDNKEELYKFFLVYPLCLASLAHYGELDNKVTKKKYFHEEYIVPQLLLLYVRKNQTEIDGIRYLSTNYRKGDSMQSMLNYVLPVTKIKDEGFDMDLMDKFEIKEQAKLTVLNT